MSNIEALQAKLPDEACGALITSDVSRRYFCGFKLLGGRYTRDKGAELPDN